MNVEFSAKSFGDYQYWQTNGKDKLKKIHQLLKEIARTSFTGTGKPEALKGDLQGYWSRRIDLEHRLVYRIFEGRIQVLSCRYHYR